MRLLALPVLAALISPSATSAQGTPYADPQNRFTVQVPDGWTIRDLGDSGAVLSGSGLTFRISFPVAMASPRDVVANLSLVEPGRPTYGWQNLEEVDHHEITILGQPTAWVIFNGTDPGGKPGTLRLQGMRGGGATAAIVISGEHATYFHERGTIEAILVTLRLGTNPPIALPKPPATGTTQPEPPPVSPPRAASQQASMGLEVRDIDDDDVQQLGLSDEAGVVVDKVRQDGPADQAGIRPDDVILELDRTVADGAAAFARRLGMHRPGDAVEMMLMRNGRKKLVSVRLDSEP